MASCCGGVVYLGLHSVQKLLNMLYNEEWTRPPPKYLLSVPKVSEGVGIGMPAGQAVKQTGFLEGVRSLASQVGLTGRQRQVVEFDEDYVGQQSVPFNTTQQQGVGSATPSVGIGVIQPPELPEGQGTSCTTPHHITPHHTAPHRTAPHHTAPHRTTSHHTAPHHTTLHHITPQHTAPHRTTSHRTAPHRTTPHHITPHHITPHHTTLHHTTPHHITPHHITPHHTTPLCCAMLCVML